MRILFAPNKEVLDKYLGLNVINLEDINYNHDHDTCILTWVYCNNHNQYISIPSIIRCSLCFTQLLIVSSLDKNDLLVIVFNFLEKAKYENQSFCDKIKL